MLLVFHLNFITTGIVWPYQGQKAVLKFVNKFLPFKWSVAATQGITLQDFPFDNEVVWASFGITFGWIILFTLILGSIVKYTPNSLVSA